MKTLKKITNLTVLAIGLLLTVSANAISLNMAVVDVADLQANFMSEVNDKLKDEFKDRQLKLQEQLDSFKKDTEKFQTDSKTMTKNQVTKVTQEMQEKQLDLQKKVQQFDSEIASRRDEELQSKLKILQGVIDKLSSENKYDMIIAKNAALFVKDEYDITKTVVARYKEAKTAQSKKK